MIEKELIALIEASAKGAKILGIAYTGGAMNISGWAKPVVIDLAGLVIPDKKIPLLANHENKTSSRIGMITAKVTAGTVEIEGEITSESFLANDIAEQARQGNEWQLSLGVEAKDVKNIEADTDGYINHVMINGQDIEGGFYHITASKLNEVSVVPIGADSNTSMRIAAAASCVIAAESIDTTPDDVEPEKTIEKEIEKMAEEKEVKEVTAEAPEVDIEAGIQAMRTEEKRIREINAACKDYPEVCAKAVAEGMSVVEAKASILDVVQARSASDVEASYINTGKGGASGMDVVEAAAVMATGAIRNGKLEDSYDTKVLEAADKMRNISIKQMVEMAARSEGRTIQTGASPDILASSGFSTVSLPRMLGNIANKSLMDEYAARESLAVTLAERLSTSNFHEHTGIRLGGLGRMETFQNGGPIKHGTMTEEFFNYKVNSVGKMIGLTREMWVNDDLAGFVRLARSLGKSAFDTREYDFWALVLANTGNFFHADNSNFITDSLDIDGISEAEATLAVQTGIDGIYINVTGTWLVVPPQLNATARAIYNGTAVQGSQAKESNANIHAGVYQPAMTPYLSSAATAWYLWSSQNKPFGIAYLNGNESPVMEEVDPGAEYLGRAWRCYFDYGLCQVDSRGAVKSDGTGS